MAHAPPSGIEMRPSKSQVITLVSNAEKNQVVLVCAWKAQYRTTVSQIGQAALLIVVSSFSLFFLFFLLACCYVLSPEMPAAFLLHPPMSMMEAQLPQISLPRTASLSTFINPSQPLRFPPGHVYTHVLADPVHAVSPTLPKTKAVVCIAHPIAIGTCFVSPVSRV